MATLFKRSGSPFWWLRYFVNGRDCRESTGFRFDNPLETRKARALCAEKNATQLRAAPVKVTHRWDAWVPQFLTVHYGTSPKSLSRVMTAWRSLRAWLEAKNIRGPSELTYDQCFNYIAWRTQGDRSRGIYKIHHNTALLELKFLHLIMEHAVRAGMVNSNPARRLGIAKMAPKEKNEITDEHFAIIWKHLPQEPEWMQVSFKLAYYTGCRLRETPLHLHNDISIPDRTVAFRNPKGGPLRAFVVPMREELVPMFEQLLKSGRTHAVTLPPLPSKEWWFFFRRIRLPQYSFHCLRVTFISRGCRAGITEREMMLLVNHASTTIHRVYQRWRVADLRSPLQKIPLPAWEGSQSTGSPDASLTRPAHPLPSPDQTASGTPSAASPR